MEGFRVLIVDDEDLIRWSLKEGLSARGHTVVEADRGRAALESGLKGVDLALLDLQLPDTDGLELAALIRRANPACRVILMTAYGSPEVSRQAAERDVWRVVDKPFDVSEVLDLVEGALHATAREPGCWDSRVGRITQTVGNKPPGGPAGESRPRRGSAARRLRQTRPTRTGARGSAQRPRG